MKKRKYISPIFEELKLDNEISLQLMSPAPIGPGEGGGFSTTEKAMMRREAIDEDPYQYENW